MRHSTRRLINVNEVKRKDIVGKVKKQDPKRYMKRLDYDYRNYVQFRTLNPKDLLKNDTLTLVFQVKDYTVTVSFQGFMETLLDVVSKQKTNYVNINTVERALMQSFENPDVKVSCTCPDMTYRFNYWASKYGYKYGKPETREPKKRNPDDVGAVCKHLAAVLSNKKWLRAASTSVNDFIKDNIYEIRDTLGLSEEDFYINTVNYALGKKSRTSRQKPGKIAPNVEVISDEEEPELNI